jgi:hypothetical protein
VNEGAVAHWGAVAPKTKRNNVIQSDSYRMLGSWRPVILKCVHPMPSVETAADSSCTVLA